MPMYDISLYVYDDDQPMHETEIEAKNISEALVVVSNMISNIQGNAHIIEVNIEEHGPKG